MNKDLRKIVKALEAQGFECVILRSGHVEVRRDGRRVATLAGSASDHRSLRNSLSHLKRAGFRWPPTR